MPLVSAAPAAGVAKPGLDDASGGTGALLPVEGDGRKAVRSGAGVPHAKMSPLAGAVAGRSKGDVGAAGRRDDKEAHGSE